MKTGTSALWQEPGREAVELGQISWRYIIVNSIKGLVVVISAALVTACGGLGTKQQPRENISSGTVWEARFGFSRAVKVNDMVLVSGTTAWNDDGEIVGKGDAYAQSIQILKNIEGVLTRAGVEINDVVRTRIFVTSFDHFDAVAKAHGEVFGDIRPATSMTTVPQFLDPDVIVEIEVDAVVE